MFSSWFLFLVCCIHALHSLNGTKPNTKYSQYNLVYSWEKPMHHVVCQVQIHCSHCMYGRESPCAKAICFWFIQFKENRKCAEAKCNQDDNRLFVQGVQQIRVLVSKEFHHALQFASWYTIKQDSKLLKWLGLNSYKETWKWLIRFSKTRTSHIWSLVSHQ